MKRILYSLLALLLLTAQAEEIDSPLVHAEEMPLAVDISPAITFQTDEAGVFAVVVLASSEELSTLAPSVTPALSSPAPSATPALSEELETEETEELETEGIVEPEIVEEEPAAFLVTSTFTPRSVTYTLTPLPPEGGENEGGPD